MTGEKMLSFAAFSWATLALAIAGGGPYASAQTFEAAIVAEFPPGRTVVVVDNVGGIITHRVVRSSTPTAGPPVVTRPPVEPTDPAATLTAIASAKVEAIESPDREAISRDVASIYSHVADQIAAGRITQPQQAAEVVSDSLKIYLGNVRKTPAFDPAIAAVNAELTRQNLRTLPEVEVALREIAAGFAQGSAGLDINPQRLGAILKLVLAVLSKNPTAIAAALMSLIRLLTAG